jgi:MFS family permease
VVVAGAGVAGGVVGLLVAARWTARRGRRHALAGGAAVAAASVAVAAMGPPVLAVAGALGAGFGVAVAWVAFQATVLRLLPGGEGTTSAVVGVLELTGLAVPLVAGIVADGWGLPAAIAVYATTGGLSVLLVLAGLGRERARAET